MKHKSKKIVVKLKVWIKYGFFVGIGLFSGLCFIYYYVSYSVEDYIYEDIQLLTNYKAALVLGTSKYVSEDQLNDFFVKRIEAASKLYRSGKIKKIIVSGDHSEFYYNEPRDMKNALLNWGVPSEDIVLDYAGLRTFDSVIRANKVFGQKGYIVVSQKFHIERALYIALANNLDVKGYIALNNADPYSHARVISRETLARLQMLLDVHVFNTQPKYLGDPIDIH